MSQKQEYYTLSTHKTLYFLWVTIILFSATVFSSYAQISEGGTPAQFHVSCIPKDKKPSK